MGIPSDNVQRYDVNEVIEVINEEEDAIEDSETNDGTDTESDSDTESDTYSDTESDTESDNDSEENDEIIRCKWIGDGSETLDDLIARLEHFAEHVRDLKRDGWELRRVMDDDYGFMHKIAPAVINAEQMVPMPVQVVDVEPIEPHTP
jgi:hypothetical protein